MTRRRLPFMLLAGSIVLFLSLIYRLNRTEDFMYYYCQAWVEARGESPYDPRYFQPCLAQVLGRPNPDISKDAGSAYPPSTSALFFPLSHLDYLSAFAAWATLLCLTSAVILPLLSLSEPWPWFLFLAWPGFLLNLAYHKFSLILFPCFLLGIQSIESDREVGGGGILGMLVLQPQWFCGSVLLLTFYKKWRAVASALAAGACISLLLSVCSGGLRLWRPWTVNLSMHSNLLVSLDNQSLFVALYKPFRDFLPGPTTGVQTIRYALSLLLLGVAYLYSKHVAFSNFLWVYMGIYLLALPYSHGSDLLWVFPLYLEVLRAAGQKLSWPHDKTLLGGLGATVAIGIFSGGYVVPNLNRLPFQYAIGYGTIFLLASKFLLDRTARDYAAAGEG